MLKDLPAINMHFHRHAQRYQRGDIVFLIDGSTHMEKAFESGPGDAALASIEAAIVLHEKLGNKTRAFFYGDPKGPEEIDLADAAQVANPQQLAPLGTSTALAPTIEALQKEYPDASPEKPLHVIIVTSGRNSDNYKRIYDGVLNWLQAPGAQILMDVILTTRNHTEIARSVSTATSKLLDGGKDVDPDKPGVNFHQAFSIEQLQGAISTAVNKRTSPEDPHKFMVDLVCETVAKGVCEGTECPLPAKFIKRPQQ